MLTITGVRRISLDARQRRDKIAWKGAQEVLVLASAHRAPRHIEGLERNQWQPTIQAPLNLKLRPPLQPAGSIYRSP